MAQSLPSPVRLVDQVARLWSLARGPAADRRHQELSAWLGLDALTAEEVLRADQLRRRGKQPRYVADRILAARARAARSPLPDHRSSAPPRQPEPDPLPVRRWAIRRPDQRHGWSVSWSPGWSPTGARAVLRWGAPEHRPGVSNVDLREGDHNQEGGFLHLRVIREPRSLRPGEHPGASRPGATT